MQTQAATNKIAELADLIGHFLTVDEQAELDSIIASNTPIWVPLPGPQTDAYNCGADILYYGGAAGGGKSDLLLGLSLTQHQRSIIYRREGTQNLALIDRMLNEIIGSRKGWNGQEHVYRGFGRQVEFGACKDLGDEQRYQGRAHDLKGFDEITHFLEAQFRFLCGWLRSATQGQRKRVVCTGNPPTNAEGQWVVAFWSPWLDPHHPNPAKPGELRWFTTVEGKDYECENGDPFYRDGELIQPLSRTFIPSRVQDNVFMMRSGYEAILQAMPEPLRSQMLKGDFWAGVGDDPFQIIPTAWVEEAQARWTEDGKKGPMDSIGADVARGGIDKTILAPRYGTWFDKLKTFPGAETPDGAIVAGLIVTERRDGAVIHVDVIGVGGSVVDHCRSNDIQVVAVNGAATARDEESLEDASDKATHTLRFRNYRAMLWWRMREALDPKTGDNLALPPDPELKADLCAPLWKLTPGGIQVEAKEDIIKRIGRSPDKGDAVVYGLIATPKQYMSGSGFQPKRTGKAYGRR